MNLTLRLFQRELMAAPRRRRFYLKRMIMPACACIILGWGFLTGLLSQSGTLGLTIMASIFSVTLFIIIPYAMGAAGSLIQRERDERTLGLLLISDITSWGCIAGKMFSAMFSAMMIILSVAPICLLGVSLGGVSAEQILAAFVVLITTLFFCVCLGLMIGAFATTERSMNGTWLLAGIFYFAIIPAVLALLMATKNIPDLPWVFDVISPFKAMSNAINGRKFELIAFSCVFHVILGFPLLWLAKVFLPMSLERGESPAVSLRIRERLKSMRGLRRWFTPAPIGKNPVFWKDWHFFYGGTRLILLRFFLPVATLMFIIVAVILINGGWTWDANVLLPILLIAGTLSALVFFAGAISNLSMCFNREKRSRALEVLLTTSMMPGEILRGKVLSALLSIAPWGVMSLLCLFGAIFVALPGILLSSRADFLSGTGMVVLGILEVASMALAYGSLSVLLSLRYRKNIGFVVCFGVFIAWNSCGRSLLSLPTMLLPMAFSRSNYSPFLIFISYFGFDILVHLVAALLFIMAIRRSFRVLALSDLG